MPAIMIKGAYFYELRSNFTGTSKCCLLTLLVLFSCIIKVNGQDRLAATFCELSGPEKCWVICHPFVANKARKITQHVRLSSLELSKNPVLDGDANGGQVDAFRHAYWMACLAQQMRWKKALHLGEAHEQGNFRSYQKGQLEDKSLPDSVASEMDRFNNGIGAEIGRENRRISKDSLKVLIIHAVREGKARIIAKNKQGYFLDCDGNILKIELYTGRWNIPKCLVPSGKGKD